MLIPAQHVWVFGGHRASMGAASRTASAERAPMVEEECILVLGVWPDTAEETLIKQLQEVHAEVPAAFQKLDPDEATRKLIRLVRSHQVPGLFKPMSMTSGAQKAIDYRNSCRRKGKKPMFRYDHIPPSFLGAVVPWDPPHTSVMGAMEISEMIQLCAAMQRGFLANL